MNRQKLQACASEWVRVAKNDVRNKINEFMQETDATPRELAYMLSISDGELEQILNGNGEMTITTFAKLLIATGNAIEIKPIEETPIGSYENIPTGPMPPLTPPMGHMPRRNPVTSHTGRPIFRPPFGGEDLGEIPAPRRPIFDTRTQEDIRNEFERRFGRPGGPFGRQMPQRPIHDERMVDETPDTLDEEPTEETSPFDGMTREKLIGIIRKRLWDSEIDVNRATYSQLKDFLKEKDKRMKENKRLEELENDPQVNAFKERLRNTVNNNPHLRKWVKDFIGNVEE